MSYSAMKHRPSCQCTRCRFDARVRRNLERARESADREAIYREVVGDRDASFEDVVARAAMRRGEAS